LQQVVRRNWKAHPIESKLTAMGKDERAISVSGYVYRRRQVYRPSLQYRRAYTATYYLRVLTTRTRRRSGQKPNRRRFYLAFAMFELDLLEPISVAMNTIVVMVLTMVVVIMMILSMVEIEHVIEIANRRHIHRDPRVLPVRDRVR
jgi:hypothetical protein